MDVPLSSSTMMTATLKALLRLAGLLCLVSVATFVLLSYSPIDPIKAYIGNDLLHVPPEQYARIAARWGLDQPLWLRYWHWFSQVLRWDLGYSMLYNAPVSEVIGQRFAASFLLLAGPGCSPVFSASCLGSAPVAISTAGPIALSAALPTCSPPCPLSGSASCCWRCLRCTGLCCRSAAPGRRASLPMRRIGPCGYVICCCR